MMIRRLHDFTETEKRTIGDLKEHGPAVCQPLPYNRNDYTWRLNGRPVTRQIYSLARKGVAVIKGRGAGARATLTREGWGA